jgi:RNA polymerase sigma-70 factor (sigma-E family)
VSGSSTGDKLEDLYLCHGPEALRLAYLLTGDRELAEDLAQEAFVRIARRLTGLRDAGAVRWYLRRTVVNLAHSHLRRRRVERAHMPVLVSSVALARTGTADVETTQAVRDAIARLSPRQRAVVVLRYYQDLTDQQIASVLNCPVGSVKSALHRATAILRQHLGQEE